VKIKINLKELNIFSCLQPDALMEVTNTLQRKDLRPGEVLFCQGDKGDELVIVEQGALSIFSPDQLGSGEAIRVFHPGEVLGEMALIDEQPRSLSARAEEKTTVLTLKKEDFQNLLAAHPEMVQAVMSGLNNRVRYTTDFLSEVRKWVGRIAEGDYNIDGYDEGFSDKTLVSLAADFARMATQVKAREEELRQEVAQLKIIIDQAKREQQVNQFVQSVQTDSGFHKQLEAAKALRKKRLGR
jgi:CRP/FNR family cyclic AMP-dependent transcriptional regulator